MTVPFLKWPGGKRWAAPRICRLVKRHLTGTYYEPFLGGGAVFSELLPDEAVLGDVNAELINVYKMVRDAPMKLARAVKAMPVSETYYYALRQKKPRSPLRRAARFLYLNRTAFAGMYRVNAEGEFNVPYGGGQRTPSPLWERSLIKDSSKALQGIALKKTDFVTIMKKAGKGDVVYCDPTYTVAHDRNSFIRYNERNFSWEDQKRLSLCARQTVARGAVVIVSNAHHRLVRALYPEARVRLLRRKSLVSRDASKRREVYEYLFILLPKA